MIFPLFSPNIIICVMSLLVLLEICQLTFSKNQTLVFLIFLFFLEWYCPYPFHLPLIVPASDIFLFIIKCKGFYIIKAGDISFFNTIAVKTFLICMCMNLKVENHLHYHDYINIVPFTS